MSAAVLPAEIQPWTSHKEADLSPESLHALFENQIPALRVRAFASADECRSFVAAIGEVGMQHVYNFANADDEKLSDYQTGYIGLTHYNYRHQSTNAYFEEVPKAYEFRDKVIARTFDPVQRMIDTLRTLTDHQVAIAEEADGRRLYAGIIRNATGGGALHADFAPFTAPALVTGRIDAQISWNLWVEHPSRGAETTVHHSPWSPDRSESGIPEQYPLDAALVEGAEKHVYYPSVGDAIFFNTRNPHEISPGEIGDKPRLQISSFVGRLPSGDMILWS